MNVDYLRVSTAAPTSETAVALARSAVEHRLAAGAQVAGSVTSVVWHHGNLVEGNEWNVVLMTTDDRYAALQQHLVREHPWTNPQITATPVVRGSREYLEWVSRTVAAD